MKTRPQQKIGPPLCRAATVRIAISRSPSAATRISETPGKPQGYEETERVASAIPGIGFSAATSTAANHTYEMEADALAKIGHHGFTVDAKAMAALLYDFLTKPDYRAHVKREFDGIRTLFEEYRSALRKPTTNPMSLILSNRFDSRRGGQ